MAARPAPPPGEAPPMAYAAAHAGAWHIEFFEGPLADTVRRVPEHSLAVEVGAGRGFHAVLAAATRRVRVLATDCDWHLRPPNDPGTVYQLNEWAAARPAIRDIVTIVPPQGNAPPGLRFPGGLAYAAAAAEHLPVATGAAHLVWSINTLEHLDDLAAHLAEAARVLTPDGYFFATTEPLYFSAYGHHLEDFFPLPYGHLLFEPEELARLTESETAGRVRWVDGPLRAGHAFAIAGELNRLTPAHLRRILRRAPFDLDGWQEFWEPEGAALVERLGLTTALRGIAREALLLRGVTFRLRRRDRPPRVPAPALLLPATLRRALRRRA